MKHIIAVFFKYPIPGTVKTRLAADLGDAAAVAAYEQLASRTLGHLPYDLAEVWVSYAPAHLETEVRAWIQQRVPENRPIRFVPQPNGDLGARLWSVVQDALEVEKASSITLVGTDCPYLQTEHFEEAWRLLDAGTDVVFGPAADGGYYLQSLRQARGELFTAIPWSQPSTLQACESRCTSMGLTHRRLEVLEDIDDLGAWQRWLGMTAANRGIAP
jgi:rSAM/selenodomain-associated transferase 1